MYVVFVRFAVGSSVWSLYSSVEEIHKGDTVNTFLDSRTYSEIIYMKQIVIKKYVEAFVTVEYTLLVAVILLIYSFLLGIGVFMYNQCILQSNVRILALEGMTMVSLDSDQKITNLQRKEDRLYSEKYLFTEQMFTAYNIDGNNISIEGWGYMNSPISVLGVGEEQWLLQASCEEAAVSPADTLRLCKRLLALGEVLGENVVAEEAARDE